MHGSLCKCKQRGNLSPVFRMPRSIIEYISSNNQNLNGNVFMEGANSHPCVAADASSKNCNIFSLVHFNARSLVPKFDESCPFVSSHNPDIVAIVKSWLCPDTLDQEILGTNYFARIVTGMEVEYCCTLGTALQQKCCPLTRLTTWNSYSLSRFKVLYFIVPQVSLFLIIFFVLWHR